MMRTPATGSILELRLPEGATKAAFLSILPEFNSKAFWNAVEAFLRDGPFDAANIAHTKVWATDVDWTKENHSLFMRSTTVIPSWLSL